MASLAIIVGLIFLTVILSGPTVYLLSKIKILPRIIIQFLSILIFALGLWWIMIVVTPIRWLGLIPIYFGWLANKNSRSGA
jgi:hypothetical protein